MEIQAYSLLETHYSQWEWDLKQEVLKWEEKIEGEVTAASADTDALDKILKKQLDPISGELVTLITKTHTSLNEQLVKYFKESKQSDVICQWQSIFERKLEEQAQLLKNEKLGEFEQLCAGKKALTSVRQKHNDYKQQMINRVTEIADTIKSQGKKLTEKQVEAEFNKAWDEIIKTLPTVRKLQDPAKVRLEVQKELINFLGRSAEKEIVEFQRINKDKQAVLTLEISSDRHISRTLRGIGTDLLVKRVITNDDRIHRAQMKTSDFLKVFLLILSKVKSYKRTHVTLMLKDLEEVIEGHTDKEYSFTLKYLADLYSTVCNYAIEEFEKMVEVFNRKHDPVVCLEIELKDDLYNIFKNKCFQIEHCKAVASTLKKVLIKAIRKKIKRSLARIIVNEMKAVDICFKNKQAFKAKILITVGEYLTKTKDSSQLIFYLQYTRECFQFWTVTYTQEYCDSNETGSELSHAQVLAIAEMTDWISKIKTLAKSICRKHSTTPTLSTAIWLEELSKAMSEAGCNVDVSTLQGTSQGQSIDVVRFTDDVEEELKSAKENLTKEFCKLKFHDMSDWENQPEVILGDMAGCCAKCPFCGEICDNTTPCGDGVKHQVEQHRPHCTNGVAEMENDVLYLGLCSSLVTGRDDHTHFHPQGDPKNKTHPYKKYHILYPDWAIPADNSTGTSLYWKWFVANYIDELAEYHCCKPCPIPDSWKELDWKEVKEELQRKMNNIKVD